MKKIQTIILIVILVFISTGCNQISKEINLNIDANHKSETAGDKYSYLPKEKRISVNVSRFIDGDTTEFILDGKKVITRYLLIDTPETVKKGMDVQPMGKDASNRTKEILEQTTTIELMLDKGNATDKTESKRLLAYVFVDGELLQDILVREGLARVEVYDPQNIMYLDMLKKSEESAKKASKGIWSIKGYVSQNGYNYEKRD